MNTTNSSTKPDSANSFKNRILKASTWTVMGHFANQLLRLASNLIMTRMLVPDMFGVMAIANVFLSGLVMFSDLGLHQNLIRSNRGDDPIFLNTIWTIQIVRGLIICLLGVLLSVFLFYAAGLHWFPDQSAYADPSLPFLMALLSISAFISGFESTKLGIAVRNLYAGKINLIFLISQLTGLAAMIGYAWVSKSIFALTAYSVVSSVVKVSLTHLILPGPKNKFHWDKDCAHEILDFGKWIFLTSILGFLIINGDKLILGALSTPAMIGLYTVAYFMVHAIDEILQKVFSIAYSALSEVIRERPEALKSVYYKFRLPADIISFLLTGILFSSGHLLILFFYDSRYLPAGEMIEILCIALLAVPYKLAYECVMALGKPKLNVPVKILQLVTLYGCMPLVFNKYGFNAALWAAAGSELISLPLLFYYKIKFKIFSLWRELIILPTLLIGYYFGLLIDLVSKETIIAIKTFLKSLIS